MGVSKKLVHYVYLIVVELINAFFFASGDGYTYS